MKRESKKRHSSARDHNKRLNAVFKALENSGIVARRNFSCCQTCGDFEMKEKIANARAKGGKPVRGFVYSFEGDEQKVREAGGLYLRAAAVRGEEQATVAVMREIVGTLESAGLRIVWDGLGTTRIRVLF